MSKSVSQGGEFTDLEVQLFGFEHEHVSRDLRVTGGREHAADFFKREASGPRHPDNRQLFQNSGIKQAPYSTPPDRGDYPFFFIKSKRGSRHA